MVYTRPVRRTQIYLDEDQKRALRLLAADRDMNVSDLIRKAVDRLLRDEIDLRGWGGRFDALQKRITSKLQREPKDEEVSNAFKRARIKMKARSGK